MKIGVSGASGHLGRAVVSELLRRPEQRRPMVRPERPCRQHERHVLNSETPARVARTGQTQGELA